MARRTQPRPGSAIALMRAGTPATELRCPECGGAWDGAVPETRPLCVAHRAEVGRSLAAITEILARHIAKTAAERGVA